MAHRWGRKGNSDRLFSWAPKSLLTMAVAMKLKMLAPWKKSCDKPRHCIKKHRHHFADKGPFSQSYGFSSSHVQMWPERRLSGEELMLSNWCWRRLMRVCWTAMSSNQSILNKINSKLEGLMLKLKLQHFGHMVGRHHSLKKDPDAGKDWG